MAYPDYSIVVISVTENGVTHDYADAFYNDELARKYYKEAINSGKRAFYYEKPTPSKFNRNDEIAIVENLENGLEAVDEVIDWVKQKIGEEEEEIQKTFELTVEDAYGFAKSVRSGMIMVGNKISEIFLTANRFRSKVVKSVSPVDIDTVAFTLYVSNKKVTGKHDGAFFFYDIEIEKLWPNNFEVSNSDPVQVVTEINGGLVNLGSYVMRKVHDGTQNGFHSLTRVDTWVPEGFIILETNERIYCSDGNGWYTSTAKQSEDNCPAEGTVLSSEFVSDITYPIVGPDGLIDYANVGSKQMREIADGLCGYTLEEHDSYSPSGTVVYETETTLYKSNGTGGVYEESKDNGGGDNGGGSDGNGDGGCQPYGVEISTEYVDGETVSGELFGHSFSYVPFRTKTVTVSDGECGTIELDPENEYTEQGTIIDWISYNDQDYIIYVDINGAWTYTAFQGFGEGVGEDGGEAVTNEDTEFPESNSPCPPAGYGENPLASTPFKLNAGGQIVGTVRPRYVTITLPAGHYKTSIMPLGGGMPSNTVTFKTGYKWEGRYLPDGNCGWVAEDNSNPWTWRAPQGTALPQGEYANLETIGTSGNWYIYEFLGFKPNNAGANFKTKAVGFRHDGQGNVTCYFK